MTSNSTNTSALSVNARNFRALHNGSDVLVLPNAWDVASALLVQEAGATAIATSSAAVAWAHGRADGEYLARELVVASARAIVQAVQVPVTVDIETGYSDDVDQVVSLARDLVNVGVVGINIEDGTGDPEALVRKIEAIKAAVGHALFVNVRTDVLLRELVPRDKATAEIIGRARLYANGGANGFFVPGLADEQMIRTIAAEIALPLNVMLVDGLPSIPTLKEWGVSRISAGTALAATAYGAARDLAKKMLASQSKNLPSTDSRVVGYGEMNELLKDREEIKTASEPSVETTPCWAWMWAEQQSKVPPDLTRSSQP